MTLLFLLCAFTLLDGAITMILLYKLHEMHNEILKLRIKLHDLDKSHSGHFEDIKSYYSKRNID